MAEFLKPLCLAAMLMHGALALAADIGGLDGVTGGLGAPGLDPAQTDALLRKAEEIQRQAEQARQQAEQGIQEKQQSEFEVRGYGWMAESCARIRHPQALLNCESANLDYLQYLQAEGNGEAERLYRRHRKSADKTIRLYRQQQR